MGNQSRIVTVNITFRHTEATDALKQYVTDKVTNALKKFVHQDTEAHVVLSVEKKRQIAEISFNTDGSTFNGAEESEDMYKSIDSVVDSMSNQLRKHKSKLTKHH